MNDSYVFWNEGPGVRIEEGGVMSLEHNDCSHNGGGPLQSEGVIRVSQKLITLLILVLRENLNGSRPSEHPPVRGENVKMLRWDIIGCKFVVRVLWERIFNVLVFVVDRFKKYIEVYDSVFRSSVWWF